MMKKFPMIFLCRKYDRLDEDCKELNFRISEFYTALYDASVSQEERAAKAQQCAEQFELISKRYSKKIYRAVYYSHYEELVDIRAELVLHHLTTN